MHEFNTSSELHSLIRLLDDPDTETYCHIRERFATYGAGCIHELEQARLHSANVTMNVRIDEIIRRVKFNEIALELQNWKTAQGSLMEGLNILCKYEFPAKDMAALKKAEDRIIRDVWLELSPNLTALEEIKVVNLILFESYGFRLEASPATSNPENGFVFNLVEHGVGTSSNLTSFYLAVCEQLKLPTKGICMPDILLGAYVLPGFSTAVPQENTDNILFYFDPADRGEIFLADVVSQYLKSSGLNALPEFYTPGTNAQIVSSVTLSLIKAYNEAGCFEKASDMKKFSGILSGNRQPEITDNKP